MYAPFSYASLQIGLGVENICVAANGATFFSAWLRLRTFLFLQDRKELKAMSETRNLVKEMDTAALIYAYKIKKDLYSTEELSAIARELARRGLNNYLEEQDLQNIEMECESENNDEKEDNKKENQGSVLKPATERIQEQFNHQKEKMNHWRQQPKIHAPSGLIYTTDTQKIANAHRTISILFIINIVISAIGGLVCLFISGKAEFLIIPGLIFLIAIPLFGYISLLLLDVLFGFFYDARKMRMMMEKYQK